MSSIVKVDTIQENTSANGITVDGLNIKDSKLVTANSVVTSNITADAVTIDKLNLISTSSAPSLEAKGDGSSQDGYIQLNCSQNSHGIKLKSPAHSANASYTLTFPVNDGDADQFLKTDGSGGLSWASAGGTMTPAFEARLASGDVSLSADTSTKLNINDEIYDSNNCYDNSSNYRFTPTTAGKYYVYGSVYYQASATDNMKSFSTQIKKNGAELKMSYLASPNSGMNSGTIITSCITDMNGSSNYLELFAFADFSSGTVVAKSRLDTFFGAFKIIE